MKKRQWAIIAGIGVLAISFGINRWLAQTKSEAAPPKKIEPKAVETIQVENGTVPIEILLDGRLQAVDKIDLFAEVNGLLLSGQRRFEVGIAYKKGEVLLRLQNEEASAAFQAALVELSSRLTQSLPDIKLDYPNAYAAYRDYLYSLRSGNRLTPLPNAQERSLDLFLTGRGIYSAYQNALSAQSRLDKFVIRAPFDGILTETAVDEGALVRAGQPLGEFLNAEEFELEAALTFDEAQKIEEGDIAWLSRKGREALWKGTVFRKNAKIDPTTQRVKVFIRTAGEGLSDGMFLQAHIKADSIANAFKIDRKLVQAERYTYLVKDSILVKQNLEILHRNPDYFIVRGLPDGSALPKTSIPGAHAGMEVRALSSDTESKTP